MKNRLATPRSLGRSDGECKGATGPHTGATDDRAVWRWTPLREGDGQRGQVDTGASGVTRFDGARVAFDELWLSVDVEIVQRQAAMPLQTFADLGCAVSRRQVVNTEACGR